MPLPTDNDNEWAVINPSAATTRTNTMASTGDDSMATATAPATAPAPAAKPTTTIELSIDAKPNKPDDAEAKEDGKAGAECTCGANPASKTKPKGKLARKGSNDSLASIISSADEWDYRAPRGPHRHIPPPPPPRGMPYRYRSRSPIRIHRRATSRDDFGVKTLTSSTHLLDKVPSFDGIADLPYPARGAVYMTTFPFTERDVKKWAWLLALGVEGRFLEERGRSDVASDDDEDDDNAGDAPFPFVRPVRRGRDRSPFYSPGTIDVPSVYLSRALDTAVISEDTQNVHYAIVTQNRHRPAGSKLLVAESRKAAGMLMYYEILKGDSIMFVGAVVGDAAGLASTGKKKHKPFKQSKYKRVETWEEALKLKEDGLIGVVC